MATSHNRSIRGFWNEYRFLSNFYPAQVEFEGIVYPTVEHAYQAAKTTNSDQRQNILSCSTPGAAKRAGRHVTLRHDWETIKVDVMTALVLQKFTTNTTLKTWLVSTGDLYIEETNRHNDTYWGVCNGVGQNLLGHILMQVRDHLHQCDL